MPKLIPALTLATTLALATLGEAAARKASPAPPDLAIAEEVCLHLGGMAQSSATLRDKGYTYLETRQRLRKVLAANTTTGPWIDWFHSNALSNLRYIYEHAYLTPIQARQDTELACLRVMERAEILTQTTTAKDRN